MCRRKALLIKEAGQNRPVFGYHVCLKILVENVKMSGNPEFVVLLFLLAV